MLNCSNCKYVHQPSDAVALCRRHPPVAITTGSQPRIAEFPKLDPAKLEEVWCGDHELKVSP